MALTSVKLVNGPRELLLWPRTDEGIYLTSLDAPSPGMREVVDDRTDDDGTRDTTGLFSSRACTIELLVASRARTIEDEVARYLHPLLRPYLVVEDDGWAQARRLMLRTDQWSAPLSNDLGPDQRKIQLQWKCPDGIWEAVDEVTETISADITTDAGGMSFPITFPMSFAPTMAVGPATVTSLGAIPSHFVARLYGPCTGPSLINVTTGEEITFLPSLSLAAGQYVEVDTREQSAVAQSDASISRLTYLDYSVTSWWRLEPGDNAIRYAPGDVDAGAKADIIYRPAWL